MTEAAMRNTHPSTPTEIEEFPNLIAGERVRSASGRLTANINPADNADIVGRFQESSTTEARAAVDAAAAAFEGWRRTPISKRAAVLLERDTHSN